MSDEEGQEEGGWWDAVTDTVGDAYESASDWAAETASAAAEWVSETADNLWGNDEEAAEAGAAEEPAYAAPEEPVRDIESERLAQDIALYKDHLVTGLTAAQGTATSLQGTWPEVDTATAGKLSTTLSELSEYAAHVSGLVPDGHAAQSAFHTARDETAWASKRAAIAADTIFSDQWKTVLDELPGLVGGALGAVRAL